MSFAGAAEREGLSPELAELSSTRHIESIRCSSSHDATHPSTRTPSQPTTIPFINLTSSIQKILLSSPFSGKRLKNNLNSKNIFPVL